MKKQKLIGQIAKLTKKQTNREYFSTLPIGTYFIITNIESMPAYDYRLWIGCSGLGSGYGRM